MEVGGLTFGATQADAWVLPLVEVGGPTFGATQAYAATLPARWVQVVREVVNVAALGGAWNGITEGRSLWRAGAGVGGAGAGAARARRPPRAPNVGPAEG